MMDIEKIIPHEKKMFMNLASKDKPDMVESDNISLFDLHEDMQTVDPIPVRELNKRVEREGDELIELQPDELQEVGIFMTDHNEAQFTSAGTDINEVKRQNAEGGLSYNEVKKLLAQRGGVGTGIYSDTDVEEVKQQIRGKNQQADWEEYEINYSSNFIL